MVSGGGDIGEGSGTGTSQDSQLDTTSDAAPWQTIAPNDMWKSTRNLNDINKVNI